MNMLTMSILTPRVFQASRCLLVFAIVGPIVAQTGPVVALTPLVESGNVVPGVGTVTRIDEFAVNDAGEWIVEVATDHPDDERDQVVLHNGVVILREGDALAEPAGATMVLVDVPYLDNDGGYSWRALLGGTTGIQDDTAYFLNGELFLQEDELVNAQGLVSTARYGKWAAESNRNGTTMVVTALRETGITSDGALLRIRTNAEGDVTSNEVVVRVGDFLPGQPDPIQTIEDLLQAMAVNDLGDMFYVAGEAAYLNDQPVAQVGATVPGTNASWVAINNALDINENGNWVLRGRLDTDPEVDQIIVRDGVKLIQEGDPVPGFPTETLSDFGTLVPIFMTNSGEAIWLGTYGSFQDPGVAIFADHEPLVVQGVSTVNGTVIETVRSNSSVLAASPSGRYVVFEAVLADGTKGAYVVNRGPIASQELRNGSGINQRCLRGTSLPVSGTTWTVELDSTLHPGAASAVLFGYRDPLELPLSIGELLIDLTSPQLFIRTLSALNGVDTFALSIPSNPAFLGRTAHAQAMILGGGIELCNSIVPTIGL